MKPGYYFPIKLVAIFIVLHFLSHAGFAQTGKVTILIKGINVKKGGVITVGIFEKGNFPKAGKHLLAISEDVKATDMRVTFEHVPRGQYAVAVFQDEDRNKKLNTSFIGFPTEPFGFSNDAKVKFGPPSFEDARVIIESGAKLDLIINLR